MCARSTRSLWLPVLRGAPVHVGPFLAAGIAALGLSQFPLQLVPLLVFVLPLT